MHKKTTNILTKYKSNRSLSRSSNKSNKSISKTTKRKSYSNNAAQYIHTLGTQQNNQ